MRDVYYWMCKFFNGNKTPEFDAYLGLVIIQGMNIIVIGRITFKSLNLLTPSKEIVVYYGIILTAFLFVINYQLFYRNRTLIKEIFSNYPKKRLMRGRNLVYLYVIISITTLFVMVSV